MTNEEASVLFCAADAALLPYRSATQSGVVQLAYAYRRPVIATAVGGLPAAVRDGLDGILCPPTIPATSPGRSSAWLDKTQFRASLELSSSRGSFARYAQLIDAGLSALDG